MIIIILGLLGLAIGSFINALVWRIYTQSNKTKDKRQKIKEKKINKKSKKDGLLSAFNFDLSSKNSRYSIVSGRSMCVECEHQLSARDLIPVFSWISLGGKCRYCKKSISWQYPLVELATAILFIISYLYWPFELTGYQIPIFIIWLLAVSGFMALVIYDLRWTLLPNKIIIYLYGLAGLYILFKVLESNDLTTTLSDMFISIIIGGGIFYVLFQLSKGTWIGGGDVKLGFALGAFIAIPQLTFMMLFFASLLGSLYSLPMMVVNKVERSARIPFGPFLILATIIVVLFGTDINDWYLDLLISGIF